MEAGDVASASGAANAAVGSQSPHPPGGSGGGDRLGVAVEREHRRARGPEEGGVAAAA